MHRGLVKSPAEAAGASLSRPSAEGQMLQGPCAGWLLLLPRQCCRHTQVNLLSYTALRKTRTRIRKYRPASLEVTEGLFILAQASLVDPSPKRVGVVGFVYPGYCWHQSLLLGTQELVAGEEGPTGNCT